MTVIYRPRAIDIKVAILGYFRFVRGMPWCMTEFNIGAWRADVFVANNELSVEIEVKVSPYDLRNDFKKNKHRIGRARGPNKLYFGVPIDMLPEAQIAVAQFPAYGIITYDALRYQRKDSPWMKVAVARSAKWLHREPPPESLRRDMAMRMSSEIFNFRLKESRALKSIDEPIA